MDPTDRKVNKSKRDPSQRMICLCNSVSQKRIEDAIASGCRTLGRIFDATCAGVGACGGSCQPTLKEMLETYARNGSFPENPRHPDLKRQRHSGSRKFPK